MDLSRDIHKLSMENVESITEHTSEISNILNEQQKEDLPDSNTVDNPVQPNCKCYFKYVACTLSIIIAKLRSDKAFKTIF